MEHTQETGGKTWERSLAKLRQHLLAYMFDGCLLGLPHTTLQENYSPLGVPNPKSPHILTIALIIEPSQANLTFLPQNLILTEIHRGRG